MPAIPFRRFTAEVLALYEPPHRRKSTRDKMRKVLSEFGLLPDVRTTSDITPALIVRWLDAHKVRRPITNRSYLGAFRAAVNIARKLRYLRVSPWEVRSDWIDWGEDDGAEPAPRHLPFEDVGRLLDRADLEARAGAWTACRLQALVYTYAFTGLRKCEALGLQAADVDLAGCRLVVRGRRERRLKTRSSRRKLALHPELAAVLACWLPRCGSPWLFPNRRAATPWLGGAMGHRALDQVKALATRAGLAGPVTIQAFRRSLATHSRRFGLGPLEVRDLLGHSSTQAQDWYLEDDAENRGHAVAKIADRPVAAVRPA